MKIYKFLVVLLVTMIFTNCTDDFSDINKNPSAINAEDISAKYFITKSQIKLMAPDRYPYWRAHLIHADRYAGHYYVGQPVRLRGEMANYARYNLFSTPAQYIIQAKGEGQPIAPEIVLTTAESFFLQAEAIVRGVGTGNANDLYRQGLRHAMLLWDVEQAEIDDFMANSPMANLDGTNDLEKIAVQRWLAYYTEGFHAWAVVRDLGFPADLADGVDDPEIYGYGDIAGKYPSRMRYGTNAYSRNNENLQEAIDRQGADQQDTELWWAR